MQFQPSNARDDTGAGRIRSLHLSLNSPVVALDDFPVGPARAGVALLEDARGVPALDIAIRSVRTGQLRFYTAEGADPVPPGALEAALSFAEGMGFLFDEDEVAARGEDGDEEAAALWWDLVGEFPEARAGTPGAAVGKPAVGGGSGKTRAPAALAVGPPRLALSKFRLVLGAALTDDVPADAPPLGRPGAAPTEENRLLSRF